MNKQKFVEVIAEKSRRTKKDCEEMLDIILDSIVEVMKTEDKLKFVGFGVFEGKQRKARIGCNPKTQVKIEIPEKRVVTFKMGKGFGG